MIKLLLKKVKAILYIVTPILLVLFNVQQASAHYGYSNELGHPNNTGKTYHTHHSSFQSAPWYGLYYGDGDYVCDSTKEFAGRTLSLSKVVHYVYIHECIYRHDSCETPDTDACTPPTIKPNCPEGHQTFVINDNRNFICEPSKPPFDTLIENGYPDDCSSGSNVYTSHPIHMVTGNKYYSQEVFMGHGANPLRFSFSYNSNTSDIAWTTSYQQYLIINETTIFATREDGKRLYFAIKDDGIVGMDHRPEVLTLNDGLYTLRSLNNTLEIYNTAGQLIAIRYPSGITHELSYTDNNNTITVTRYDDALIINKNSGLVSSITLPDNSTVNMAWDTSGDINNLTQITFADNTTRNYLYENTSFAHHITGILDENGNRIASVVYNADGRAISSEVGGLGSGIERSQIEYHPYESGVPTRRTVTNALGKQTTYHFNYVREYKISSIEGHASANCAAANQAYTYDTNGFVASKTDWEGNVTNYVHNDRGLETSRTEAAGTPQERTITTEWHDSHNLRTRIIEPERETRFTYDDNGRLLSQEVTPR